MKQKTSRSSSVERALEIIECFTKEDTSLTLKEIMSKTGFSKTSVFRMITSLENYGYLKTDQSLREKEYSLGWAFLHKANLISSELDIRDLAYDDLIELRNRTELTTQLVIQDGNEAVYIEQIESLNIVQIYSQVGRRAPLYIPSCPRLLLAYMTETEQDYILENTEFNQFTKNTLTNIAALKEELAKIKKDGVAISKGELHEGILEIAAPIFSASKKVIAAISIVGLESEFTNNRLEDYIVEVKRTANRISQKTH